MGLFNLFNSSNNINKGLKRYETTQGAVLLDVRTPFEYGSGHIPSSRNIPLDRITTCIDVITDKSTPLFVYCQSGGRSARAASALIKMGYSNVTNIGGIASYKGRAEK